MADPRTSATPETVNERVRDRTIRHLIWLTRLQTQQANEITEFIESEVRPDIEGQLRRRLARIEDRGFDTGPATTRRLESMIAAMRSLSRERLGQARQRLAENLSDIAQSEAEWQAGVIQQAAPVQLEWTIPATEQLRQAALERPFDGQPLSRWFDALDQQTQQGLERAIRRGVVEGETVDQIVRRVRGTRANGYTDGLLHTTTRNAQAITRTAVQHASTQARLASFEQNRDIVRGVQWVATIDDRTCMRCMPLDGAADDGNGNALQGRRSLRGVRPPRHVSCRCSITPVIASWRELGIDMDEAPEGTRASMDGQVPGSINYNDWLRKRVAAGDMEVVEEALGKKRAKLFAAGGVDVQQFTDRRGRVLTLRELRQRERDVFERVGVTP